jgi:transcriptional antiterminator RfaH
MSTRHWYALRSGAHKENILYKQLVSKEIECFFPCVKVNPVNPRSAKWRPLFPNYMFVRIDLDETGNSLFEYLPFSQGLVELGGEPASISEKLIQGIQQALQSINERGGMEFNELTAGTRIRVIEGPFQGYEGIFDMKLSGSDRVLILLNLSRNRQIRTELSVGSIQKQKD